MPSKQVVVQYIGDATSAVRASQQLGQAAEQAHGKVASSAANAKGGLLGLVQSAEGAEGRFGSLGGAAGLLSGGMMGAAGAATALGGFLVASGKAAMEAEAAQAKLTAALLLNPAGGTADDMDKLAQKTMDLTVHDDEATKAAEAFLITSGHTREEIQQLIPLVADYASKTGKDMVSAAQDVDKAIHGKARALQEAGIYLDAASLKTGAYDTVVQALTTHVGGFAENEAKTTAGSLQQLGNQFHELEESVGKALLPVLKTLTETLIPIVRLFGDILSLNPAKIFDDVKDHAEGLTKAAINLATGGIGFLAMKLADGGLAAKVLEAGMKTLAPAVDDATTSAVTLGTTMAGEGITAAGDYLAAVKGVESGMKDTMKATDDAAKSLKDLHDFMNRGRDAALDLLNANEKLSDAQQRLKDDTDKLKQMQADAATPAADLAKAQRQVDTDARNLIATQGDLEGQMVTLGEKLKGSGESFDSVAESIRATGEKAGLSEAQIDGVIAKIRDEWNPAVNSASTAEALRGALADLKAKGYDVSGALGAAIAQMYAWNPALDSMNTHVSPHVGQTINFAGGTSDAPGGWATVGESGPEYMYVPQHSTILPHGQTPRTASGGSPITIIVYGAPGQSNEAIGASVFRRLNAQLATAGRGVG